MAKATAAPVEDQPVVSPLDEIKALNAKIKELKANAGEAMATDAKSQFLPLHERMSSAFAAIVIDDYSDETDEATKQRAAHALKYIGENMTEYKRLGRAYHKYVYGVTAPRTPKKDAAPADDAAE